MDHDDPPSGGPPSPDDRLWRHPSELAMAAAAATPAAPAKRSHRSTAVLLAVVVGLAGAATATLVAPPRSGRDEEARILPVVSTVPRGPGAVVDGVAPAIVRISVEDGAGRARRGSGVVVRPDGLVVTSALLVDGVDQVEVTWASGRTERATVEGTDPVTGLAAVSVDDTALASAIVDAFPAQPGQAAYTVAAWAGAADPSISRARVTAAVGHVDEAEGRLLGLISITQPVPRWADGGALVDATGGWQGISLAVPDDPSRGWAVPAIVAVRVAEDIRRLGFVDRGWLGVWGATVAVSPDPGDVAVTGAGTGSRPVDRSGVVVLEVSPGSPAEAIGILVGDVVLTVDSDPVASFGDLRSALTLTRPGDAITVELLRDGEPHELRVTLAPAPR